MQSEAQFIEYQQKGRLWRCRILVADLTKEPSPDAVEVLFTTPWMRSPEAAENLALSRYFPIYEFRQGFKHPEDPTRTSLHPAPPCDVVTMRAA